MKHALVAIKSAPLISAPSVGSLYKNDLNALMRENIGKGSVNDMDD